MKNSISILMFVIAATIFNSCSPATVITGSWKNKSFVQTKKYKTVFIAGIVQNLAARQALEDAFYKQATQRGYQATKSIDVFQKTYNSQNTPSQSELLEKIRAAGADVILTITLKSVQNQTRYVPGTESYNPVPMNGYYGNFYGYYGPVYNEVYTPGYYANDKVYFMECNIYDASTEELIWTAQSETTNPPKLDAAAREYANVVIYQMQKDGILNK
ncbi:MAG TPA: hypothetical protein PKD91_07070 [Bacteroidia bacterium]|nr:hypothetical protein [Bacteroidia bacterium]